MTHAIIDENNCFFSFIFFLVNFVIDVVCWCFVLFLYAIPSPFWNNGKWTKLMQCIRKGKQAHSQFQGPGKLRSYCPFRARQPRLSPFPVWFTHDWFIVGVGKITVYNYRWRITSIIIISYYFSLFIRTQKSDGKLFTPLSTFLRIHSVDRVCANGQCKVTRKQPNPNYVVKTKKISYWFVRLQDRKANAMF